MAAITEQHLEDFKRLYITSSLVIAASEGDALKRQHTLNNLISSMRKTCTLYGPTFLSTLHLDDGVLQKILNSRIGDEAFAAETVKKRFVAIKRFIEVVFVEQNDEDGWRIFNSALQSRAAVLLIQKMLETLRETLQMEEELSAEANEGVVTLKDSEAKLFIVDVDNLKSKHQDYIALTHDLGRVDPLQLAQNRFITLLYLNHEPARLEYMRIVTKVPQQQKERDEMDAQRLNYVFSDDATDDLFVKINDHKNVTAFDTYTVRLDEQEKTVYRALLPLAEQANLHYLFATNSKAAPFGFTLRLQEAFQQAIGVPLSVDVLRKMFIYRTLHNRPVNRSRANEVTKKMRTNIDTITRYYVFDVPDDHQDPQIIINGPLPVRRGQRSTQTDEEKEALLLTQGILWDKPGNIGAGRAANPWNLLKNSQHVITINGRRKKVATILQNRSVNTIAAMARAIKKKQNN